MKIPFILLTLLATSTSYTMEKKDKSNVETQTNDAASRQLKELAARNAVLLYVAQAQGDYEYYVHNQQTFY